MLIAHMFSLVKFRTGFMYFPSVSFKTTDLLRLGNAIDNRSNMNEYNAMGKSIKIVGV